MGFGVYNHHYVNSTQETRLILLLCRRLSSIPGTPSPTTHPVPQFTLGPICDYGVTKRGIVGPFYGVTYVAFEIGQKMR